MSDCGQRYLFEMYRGDDFTFKLQVVDTNDEPVDISGWAFKCTMKLSTEHDDANAPVQVNIPPRDDEEATNGFCYVSLPAEQTRNLKPALYYFDLQRESNGSVSTIFIGRVKVHADVTRRTGNE